MPEKNSPANWTLIPVVRYGEVLEITPHPKPEQLGQIADRIEAVWSRDPSRLKYVVKEAAGGDCAFSEDPPTMTRRWERGGETLVLDITALRAVPEHGMSGRLTFALCGGKASTKIWGRIGASDPNSDARSAGIRPTLREYRRAARAIAQYGLGIVEHALAGLTEYESSRQAPLLVTALATSDTRLRDQFARLPEEDLSRSDLLSDVPTAEALAEHFERVFHLRDITSADEKTKWVFVPAVVEGKSSYLELRESLFYYRKRRGVHWVLGVGYDDSARGDLASKASLEAARWIAEFV